MYMDVFQKVQSLELKNSLKWKKKKKKNLSLLLSPRVVRATALKSRQLHLLDTVNLLWLLPTVEYCRVMRQEQPPW